MSVVSEPPDSIIILHHFDALEIKISHCDFISFQRGYQQSLSSVCMRQVRG